MNYYIGLLFIFATLMGYTLFLMKRFEFNSSKSLFFSIVLIMFLMSLFSYADKMVIGFYAITLFGIIYLFYSLIMIIIKKDISIIKQFNNPSFVVFCILFTFLAFVTPKIYILMGWDECSYWATMVKRLYYFNSYLGGSNFYSMYYPPALTSLNYFFVKFIGFADSSLYFAQYLLVLSGFCFLINDFKWRKILWACLIFLSTYVFLILILKPYVLTLYSEIPLIILFGSCLITLFFANSKIDYIFVCLLLCDITWIKSNGLALCLLIIICAILKLFDFYNCQLKKEKPNKIKNYILIFAKVIYNHIELIIVMITPFAAKIVFEVFLKANNIVNRQSINAGFGEFINAIFKDSEYNSIITNFGNALNINYNYSTLNMSSIIMLILITLGFFLICRICKKEQIVYNNSYYWIAIIVGFCIYSASLMYAYCFLFSRGEANILASFDRYMNSYIGGIGISLIGIFGYIIANCKSKGSVIELSLFYLIGILCVTNIGDIYDVSKQLLPNTSTTTTYEISKGKEIAYKYKSYFDEDDKVGFIIQNDYGLTVWASIYYMTPVKMYDPRFEGDIWSIRTFNSTDDVNTVVISPGDYIKKLKEMKITHIIVVNTNDDFKNSYKEIFDNNNIVNGIYKLDYSKNNLILVKAEDKK